MNKNDLTQMKNAICMPSELADTLLQGCALPRRKRPVYSRCSRLALTLTAAFAILITGSTSHAAYNIYQEKNVAVFMDNNLSQPQIDRIGEQLSQIDGVSSCRFISADEAWANFKAEYLNRESAAAFSENPLKDSFNYRLSIRLNADTRTVRNQIRQIDGVRLVQDLSELKN